MLYDSYNREERAICSHLFRLLLNSLHAEPDHQFFRAFLKCISASSRSDPRLTALLVARGDQLSQGARVYSEVALVRDVVATGKLSRKQLDAHCREHNDRCRLHKAQCTSDCDKCEPLWEPRQLLCVKPDIAIVLADLLIVIEAKFVLDFDDEQLKRTKSLVAVWRDLETPMAALGLAPTADAFVLELGCKSRNPHIDWQTLADLAKESFGTGDPSVAALKYAQELLRDHSEVENNDGYIRLDGLQALKDHIATNGEGYVGFVGGHPALEAAMGDSEYLRRRKYKWLKQLDPSKHKSGNWIHAREFIAGLESGMPELTAPSLSSPLELN